MKTQYATRLVEQVAFAGGEALLGNIVSRERERGYKVVRPGDVDWLPTTLWKNSSICSIDGDRVRIVLIEARHQKSGAFRRLLGHIADMEMIPVVIEPHDRLAATLASWGWKRRRIGSGFDAETIWYPRP